jgi:hypothetical protein
MGLTAMPEANDFKGPTSGMGHFRTSRPRARSALPLPTDIVSAAAHVRKVPQPDSCGAASFDHLVGGRE